jgi:hypothetical protein
VNEDGGWVDPEATGDDAIWRETCDAADTFIADHEPEGSGYGFEDATSVEEILSLALDATPDDLDHMIAQAAVHIHRLADAWMVQK